MRKYDNEMLMEFVKSNNIKTADDLNSAFREMYKDVIQVMLENEMNNHLGYDKGSKAVKETDNRRNGYSDKKVRSSFGELLLSVPRDRADEFEPVVVEKHSRELSSDIENKIISMYSKGMSTRDISIPYKRYIWYGNISRNGKQNNRNNPRTSKRVAGKTA